MREACGLQPSQAGEGERERSGPGASVPDVFLPFELVVSYPHVIVLCCTWSGSLGGGIDRQIGSRPAWSSYSR